MGSSGQEIPHAAVGPMAGGAADVPPTPPENVPPPISGTVPAEAPNVGNPVLPDPGAGNPNLADSGNVPSGGTEPASTSVGGVANNVPGEPSAPSTASTSPLDRPGYKPLGTPGGAEPPPDIGGTPLESGTRNTIQALTQSRENIATTEAARTIEKGQRIAAADAASRAALAAGKTPAEAQALSEAALAGKYTAGIAADAALTPEDVSSAMPAVYFPAKAGSERACASAGVLPAARAALEAASAAAMRWPFSIVRAASVVAIFSRL